jgi:hypothetical protein
MKRIGKNSQPKKIIAPRKKIKISATKPKIIKNILIIAPMILEKPLDTAVSRYLVKLNPLP